MLDLNELRQEINDTDREIVELFKKRMAIATSVAEYKREHGLPVLDAAREPELTVLAESDEAGVFLAIAEDGKKIFVNGHPEYDRYTLNNEYYRDLNKGLPIQVPYNYYPDDDPSQKPLLQWRSHSNNLYSNWLNYYIYQITPYEL